MNAASPERPIRIASWNIHGAVGRDRRCDPDRILAAIAAMEADIVALQEVDGRTHLGRKAEAFETMTRALGGYVVEARLHGAPGREHGNLLWSRWPIEGGIAHPLPGGLERRGLIEATIATPAGPLRVYATHYGLLPTTRLRQVTETARRISASTSIPTVLVGDLNEWLPRGPVHRALGRVLRVSLRPRTFPAAFPAAPLDRLYASIEIAAKAVAVPAGTAPASDHLPLIADLRLPPRA